jgi:hypothetical protein
MNYSDTLLDAIVRCRFKSKAYSPIQDGKEPIPLIEEGDAHAACIEP